MRVNMHEAKTNLSRLVAVIKAGETDEVEIARAGHVVARIVPPRQLAPRRPGQEVIPFVVDFEVAAPRLIPTAW